MAMVTMSAVWDRTTEFVSDNLGAVTGVALLGLVVPAALAGIIAPLGTAAGPGLKLGLGLLTLLFSLWSAAGKLALVALALDAAAGAGVAWRRGLNRLPALIGVSLILMLAGLVIAVPVLAILLAYGVDLMTLSEASRPSMPPVAGLWIALYLLLAVPVLLWVGARLLPLSPVVVEERRGAGALSRAFALSRGYAARIAGVIILYLVVASVATLAAKTVVGSVMRIAFGDDGSINAASVVTAIMVALVGAAFSVLAAGFAARLYLALRERDGVGTAA